MLSERNNRAEIRRMTYLAVLSALVVILQVFAAGLRVGTFNISLVLLPIVIGAAVCGRYSSLWLGFVFGMTVLLSGQGEPFFSFDPLGTVVTVLAKGMLAGLVAGIVYAAFEKRNTYLAVILAALVCPIVNTGVFLLGCFAFFMPLLREWAGAGNVLGYMITGLVGVNFLIELLTDIVLSPAVLRLIEVVKKSRA